MHKTIRAKLFLTFLITTSLVVSGMYAFMRWSLEKGFTEFVENRQQERVTILIGDLTEFYANNQNWHNLATSKQKWIDLLWHSSRRQRPPDWINKTYKEPNDVWPPTLSELPSNRHQIPLEMRTMLLNSDKSIIFGRQEALAQLALHPIHYQDNIVGYLGVLPGKVVNHSSEVRFMERQSKAFRWIALLMIVLSASLALILAYILGRRLKHVTSAAKSLAMGHYDVRLPVESKDELGQLARDFNELAIALEQSEQTRRRWVADISHELRTPLAVLSGELEALQDGVRSLTLEAIDSLYSDVLRLNRLTEDLYQLSLSDQGALSYRKVDLDPIELLEEDVNHLDPLFKDNDISIHWINQLKHPVQIYADPDRLSQLYRNLLTNSANYTDSHGQLVITLSLDNNALLINFSDSAPGVPESEHPKLFERFYRLESSRNSHHGGAGLGLALCANIVKAHNGLVHAESSAFNGLSIQIELPLSL